MPTSLPIGRAFSLWIALAVAGATCTAAAQAPCPEEVVRFAEACDAGPPRLRAAECPAGHVIFDADGLYIDVRRSGDDAFVRVGELGISPVGQFRDWREAPERHRAALDALVRCVRARPDPIVDAIGEHPPAPSESRAAPGEPRVRTTRPLPWRVLLGALLALGILVRRFGTRGLAERAMPLVALGAIVLLARQLLVPESYFHQNGQGPLWVRHALGEPSAYGPGYAQLFWLAARAAGDPDGAVFLAQSVLCALVPPAGFAIARGVGAPRIFAWAVAVALAASPLLARIARSESYFATCGALLFLAAAILAVCVRPEDGWKARLAGMAASGLFVAQAALVHPVCWLAGAVLPGVVLVGGGDVTARVRLAVVATAVIAAVVLAFAGPDLYDVLAGSLGHQWLGAPTARTSRAAGYEVALLALIVLAAVGVALRSRAWQRTALAVVVIALVAAMAWMGYVLGDVMPWIAAAYGWLYAPAPIAAGAALVRELSGVAGSRERLVRAAAAGAVLVSSISWYAVRFADLTRLPTDAREALAVRRWRAHLPRGAVVAHLARAGRQIVELPLYERYHLRISADRPPVDLTAAGSDVFYLRSSLCTSARGREMCEAVEAAYQLEPVRRAVFPAVPSMDGLEYDRDEVEIVLYRVRDRRSGSSTHDGSSDGREGT